MCVGHCCLAFCLIFVTPVGFTTIKFTAQFPILKQCVVTPRGLTWMLTMPPHWPLRRGVSAAVPPVRRLLLPRLFPQPLLSVPLTSPTTLSKLVPSQSALEERGGQRSQGSRHSPRGVDTREGAISTGVETRTRVPRDDGWGRSARNPPLALWEL